jgi:hypothetical protein
VILGKFILVVLVILVIAWMLGGFLRNFRRRS